MKKLLKILTMVAAVVTTAVLFTTCKQFRDDPEEMFSYWTSEVIPKDFSIDRPSQELNGVYYIPSTYTDGVTITIKLHNPRKFNLIMPTGSGDAGTVINFPKFTGGGSRHITRTIP